MRYNNPDTLKTFLSYDRAKTDGWDADRTIATLIMKYEIMAKLMSAFTSARYSLPARFYWIPFIYHRADLSRLMRCSDITFRFPNARAGARIMCFTLLRDVVIALFPFPPRRIRAESLTKLSNCF